MRAALFLFASLLLAGPRASGVRDDNYVVLAPSAAKTLLKQCSRGAPAQGEGGWTPGAADIARLETALPAALAKARTYNRQELAGAPQGWFRQYVGIVRGGRRYIYGNFIPDRRGELRSAAEWQQPIIVCDGGVSYFGAEFDVEKAVFTHFGFNGYA